MLVEVIGDYKIWESDTSGSNVKGNAKSRGIQVRKEGGEGGYFLLFTANYKIGIEGERLKAIEKCRKFINKKNETQA